MDSINRSRRALLVAAPYLGAGLTCFRRTKASSSRQVVAVTLTTEMGVMQIVVDIVRAPLSAGDFLKHVDLGLFRGGSFFRTVRPDNDPNPFKISAIQGGTSTDTEAPPIAHESTQQTGIHHLDGTISLGRTTRGTATGGSFFICLGAQPELNFGGRRNPDGLGFAAFGHISQGMSVVKNIWGGRTKNPGAQHESQMLVRPVMIKSIKRA
jgi:peptidyl-prolyl cis-trans isomerase A (cyclophilin A)